MVFSLKLKKLIQPTYQRLPPQKAAFIFLEQAKTKKIQIWFLLYNLRQNVLLSCLAFTPLRAHFN